MFKHFLVLIIFLCIFEIRANEPEGTTSAVPDGAAFSVSSITGTTRTSRRLKCQWDTAATLCGAHNGGPAHIANVDIGNKASEVLDLAELSPGDPVADVWGGA